MTARGAALVTGAGGRLGRAMAVRLAERGHDVAVHFHASEAGAAGTVALIEALGRRAVALRADLLGEDVQALVPRAAAALGPLTVLVNSASIFDRDALATATAADFHRHLAIHGLAPMLLTQAFAAQAPAPRPDEMGEPVAQALVVNLIDQRVLKLTPEFFTYTLSKALLWTMTQTAAQALAPRVRVNAIAPGPTLRAPRQTEAHFRAQRAGCLLGRGADAEDVVAALDYLLAAKAVTGTLLPVDGGQHLGWRTRDVVG